MRDFVIMDVVRTMKVTLAILLCVVLNHRCQAITTFGIRPIPIHGWEDSARGGIEPERERDVRNAEYPAPQLPWEEALRHSIYLTLVREKIDDLLLKQRNFNRQHPDRTEEDAFEGKTDDSDINLWRDIRKAPFRKNSKERGPVFGDIAILSRGKLVETRQGYQFIEDEDVKECIECHLYRARPNELEAEKTLAAACQGNDCKDKRVKALWTIRRIRHRNPANGGTPFMYELMFSIAAAKADGKGLDYNIPSQTFTIQETERQANHDERNIRKDKLIFKDRQAKQYNPRYYKEKPSIEYKDHGEVEKTYWVHKNVDRQHAPQSATNHNKDRYSEFYQEPQLNMGEFFIENENQRFQTKSPYISSGFIQQDKSSSKNKGHKKYGVASEEEYVQIEEFKYPNGVKTVNKPIITHLHHHYYLNDKGEPVLQTPTKYDKFNNYDAVYIPNMYKDIEINSEKSAVNPEQPPSSTGTAYDTILPTEIYTKYSNPSTAQETTENRYPETLRIPIYVPTITEESRVVTNRDDLQSTKNITIVYPEIEKQTTYRSTVPYQTTSRTTRRRLKPTKPFRPSQQDMVIKFSEPDPLYPSTLTTPVAYTTSAQINTSRYRTTTPIVEEKYEENSEVVPTLTPAQINTSRYRITTPIVEEKYEENSEVIPTLTPAQINTSRYRITTPIVEEKYEENSEVIPTLTPAQINTSRYRITTPIVEEKYEENSVIIPTLTPIVTTIGGRYTEPSVAAEVIEDTVSSFDITTVQNEKLDSEPYRVENIEESIEKYLVVKPTEESTTINVESTQIVYPESTTETKDDTPTKKFNSHRIERTRRPKQRVKLQKKFSELVNAQLSPPEKNSGTTVQYTVTFAPETTEGKSTEPSRNSYTSNRSTEGRNRTNTFVPQRNRSKYQRKTNWTNRRTRTKPTTTTPMTTTEIQNIASEESEISIIAIPEENITELFANNALEENTTVETERHQFIFTSPEPIKIDQEEHNNNNISDIEISQIIPLEITNITLPAAVLGENTTTPNNDVTLIELNEFENVTNFSDPSDSMPLDTIAKAVVQTTESSRDRFSVKEEDIFTPLTKKSYVTSISLKLGNKTRPYYQTSTLAPETNSSVPNDNFKWTENTTFMEDLLKQFDFDNAMKAKISDVPTNASQFRVYRAEDNLDQKDIQEQSEEMDSITQQIIEHARSINIAAINDTD